jgi:hypothetical protein
LAVYKSLQAPRNLQSRLWSSASSDHLNSLPYVGSTVMENSGRFSWKKKVVGDPSSVSSKTIKNKAYIT